MGWGTAKGHTNPPKASLRSIKCGWVTVLVVQLDIPKTIFGINYNKDLYRGQLGQKIIKYRERVAVPPEGFVRRLRVNAKAGFSVSLPCNYR